MNNEEYLDKIRSIISEFKNKQDSSYFEGHLPRFIAQIEMFREFLDKTEIRSVYDLGTDIPYTSLYFNFTQGAEVFLGCIDTIKEEKIAEGINRANINLNFPKRLPPVDLVICTECLEHLPSNLYRVRQALSEYVKDGKYLLLSFPLNGMNAKDYESELPQDMATGHGHLREFTEKTARDFYVSSGFRTIGERITFTQAYGGKIMNVLLKKEIFI